MRMSADKKLGMRTQVMAVPAEPGRHRNPAKTGGTANKGQKQAVPVR